ncbi:Protein of unknown function [Saccharopolyspora antimicrobica]|uniref:Uncharacterized protein DUF1446 n=1 Tax=Saccharopolyspora antimicrobica TaxID=455193 RepID=A0A1I5DW55_9PSEU|nr:acyclic terpene utilization AtuA family protein [Saccharopolyspora antimicrobica]RKT84978.1 uncharacterized protein DUF1446 [Saccharopolyspora antimicrobica]SFO02991.1 Protein of unknown function [Saccharopolyspora antimicrobica]
MRIGSGAGFAGDRIEPAVQLAARGELDDLVLECLAERTIALGQQRRLRDPALGHDPRLRARFRPLLPVAIGNGVRVVTNMGSANPLAAGETTRDLLVESGLRGRIAVVTGDDVLDRLDLREPALEDGIALAAHGEVVSANAYLGAEALLPALDTGADVVLTGRVADPSLFLAPMAHRLGWDLDDWPRMAAGTLVGHLLECAGQVTGGYFADPGAKEVPDLANLGFPYAAVESDGTAVIGKLPDTGGLVSTATVREQLLYEVTDPAGYRTPDVVLDFREVRAEQVAADRVRISGAVGRPRPEELKVSVGYRAGHRAECGISYAGPNADRRARLAADIVTTRLRGTGLRIRADVLGRADECRLRVAALAPDPELADLVCHEVESLYTNGPAGGGGVRTDVREVIGIVSTLIPRTEVETRVTVLEADGAAA